MHTQWHIYVTLSLGLNKRMLTVTENDDLNWCKVVRPLLPACPSQGDTAFPRRSLSHVWLFATPWTVAWQTPLSLEFPRQDYWSRYCHFLLWTQGLNLPLLHLLQGQANSLPLHYLGSPSWSHYPITPLTNFWGKCMLRGQLLYPLKKLNPTSGITGLAILMLHLKIS